MNIIKNVKKIIFVIFFAYTCLPATQVKAFNTLSIVKNIAQPCWKAIVKFNTNTAVILTSACLGSFCATASKRLEIQELNQVTAQRYGKDQRNHINYLYLCSIAFFSPMIFEFVYKMYTKK